MYFNASKVYNIINTVILLSGGVVGSCEDYFLDIMLSWPEQLKLKLIESKFCQIN